MIGRVDIWTHERSNIRFHDGVEYTEEDETISFNFNDADWNNIARYESETDTITKMNGEDLDTPFIEENGVYISYSLFKDENSDNAWLNFKGQYDLPDTLTDEQKTQLGFDWDDVDQINIGTRTETHPVTQIRDEEKVENSTRVEYFRKVVPDENNPEHYFYEFLGVTESEGGFFEIRNSNWEEIGQVANLDSLQTFDQISSDFFQLEES